MWRQLRLVLVWAAFIVPSCADDAAERDTRLGELGRVKFNGGGGCNGSTTLAAGSTAQMSLVPVEGVLPSDLAVSSTRPEVIEAEAGEAADEIVLHAVGDGEARVELRTGDTLFDWLGFDVADAESASFEAPTVVIEGGHYVLEVQEIYGECGEECPLIGSDFMQWTLQPQGAMVLLQDAGRRVEFTATEPGGATIAGIEPTTSESLLEHAVTVVPVADAGGLSARITVDPPEEDARDPAPLPGRAPLGSLFVIALSVDTPQGGAPIFGKDIEWTLDVEDSAVARGGGEGFTTPEGPIFTATAVGTARLTARVALLDAELKVEVEVHE